ncbi:MAG: transposase family protein [Hyphomicrobium sp.]|uniref:integrase catalytic domain-containing protein n=1 Tax=Hyphomicrobium sp. TaxID=82 RepID=UPI0025BDD494|nr:transposase family protein [Hyphomicrobium sp.]MBZ0208924.1 transposase family protein [Hyphomicrobium sp.]
MMGRISMRARRELVAAVADRYRMAERMEKGRILDELTAVTGWHRKHAVRVLNPERARPRMRRPPRRIYSEAIRDALIALWEASDRVCGKRLKVMIPVLLPALERHGRLNLGEADRALVLTASAAMIDRMLRDVRIAARGGRRRRAGFSSAVRREVPIRTFNDWGDPPPGFCEADLVAHGGVSVTGAFIQTLTIVDVATGWTECLPLLVRQATLVVQAIERAQSLFPWLICGLDFDNDSAFMNDVVVPWCRAHGIAVTRSRAYKKNDQAFVEQKNGAVVRRLVGYGRFEGIEATRALARLFAAARLYVNFFQPSFKLREKAARGCQNHQALPRAGDTLRARSGTPGDQQGHQTQAARDAARSGSGRLAGGGARGPGATGQARRPTRRIANRVTYQRGDVHELRRRAWQGVGNG